MAEIIKGDFCVKIDFEKGSESPSRVFRAMSEIIDTLHVLDKDLIQSIDVEIEPVLILEDIEVGSLKAFLKNVLHTTDDNALKDLNWKGVVGNYLVKAKHKILKYLDGKEKIATLDEVKELERGLLQLAEETEVRHLPAYAPMPPQRILEDIGQLSSALSNLTRYDSATLISEHDRSIFNQTFQISSEKIEELLTKETITNDSEMILKVKKPDYLGRSQWDFKYDQKTIPGKILDEPWLDRFQKREIDVRPGDSLRADVRISVKYGDDGSVVAMHHELLRIRSVIKMETWKQGDLDDGNY